MKTGNGMRKIGKNSFRFMVLIIIVSIMMMFTDCSDGGSGVDSNLVEGNKTSTINVSQKDGTTIQVTMYYPDGTPYESWVYK